MGQKNAERCGRYFRRSGDHISDSLTSLIAEIPIPCYLLFFFINIIDIAKTINKMYSTGEEL